MYNAQSYAIQIERLLKLPSHSADKIANNPLNFLKKFLDEMYEKSEDKAKLIDDFDEKYSNYKNTHLINWTEKDAEQLVKDLRKIFYN